jgi:hypothetical protein
MERRPSSALPQRGQRGSASTIWPDNTGKKLADRALRFPANTGKEQGPAPVQEHREITVRTPRKASDAWWPMASEGAVSASSPIILRQQEKAEAGANQCAAYYRPFTHPLKP